MRPRSKATVRRDLAERLAQAIEGRGISREEFRGRLKSKGLTTAKASISTWLSGQSAPSVLQMMVIPEVLGVSGHWLLTGEGPRILAGGEGGLSAERSGAVAALGRVRRFVEEELERTRGEKRER